jgi:hypothetical protein
VDAVVKAQTFELFQAMTAIFGYEIDDQSMALIEQHYAAKEQREQEMAEQVQQQREPQTEPPRQPSVEAKSADYKQIQHEVTIWRDKCLSAIKRGKPASSVDFIPAAIPADVYDRLVDKLRVADGAEAVKDIFVRALQADEQDDALMILANELKRANDILLTSAP